MTTERLEDRALAALRVIDGETGVPVVEALTITAAGVTARRNRRGLYVIARAPGLGDYADSFADAPAAAPVDLDLVLADPSGRYLARRVTVRVPRDADPANAATAGSVFRPVDVRLYLSPAAQSAAGSAVIRASVVDAAPGNAGLGGALLRVIADGVVLARGTSDARGEALVPVPGIRVTTWTGTGAGEIDVTIEAAFDPAPAGASGVVPDPDALDANFSGLKTASVASKLASRREVVVSLAISLA